MTTPSIVQSKVNQPFTTDTVAIAFDSDVTAGNALVFLVSKNSDGRTLDSASDNQNGAWANKATQQVVTNNDVWAGYFLSSGSGPCTITLTFSSSATFRVSIYEVADAAAVDVTFNGEFNASNVASGAAFDPAATIADDSITFVVGVHNSNAGTQTPPDGSWVVSVDEQLYYHGYRIRATGTTDSATWGFGTSRRFASLGFSLKDGAGPPPSGGGLLPMLNQYYG